MLSEKELQKRYNVSLNFKNCNFKDRLLLKVIRKFRYFTSTSLQSTIKIGVIIIQELLRHKTDKLSAALSSLNLNLTSFDYQVHAVH